MAKPDRSIKRFGPRLILPLLLAVAVLSSALYAQAGNAILLIGDGMGPAHVSAGRYQLLGPEGYLSMEGLPVTGLVKTHSADHETGGLVIEDGELEAGSLDADWTTRGHSAVSVPIYAGGPGSESFTGVMDNTDIPRLIAKALGLNFPAD